MADTKEINKNISTVTDAEFVVKHDGELKKITAANLANSLVPNTCTNATMMTPTTISGVGYTIAQLKDGIVNWIATTRGSMSQLCIVSMGPNEFSYFNDDTHVINGGGNWWLTKIAALDADYFAVLAATHWSGGELLLIKKNGTAWYTWKISKTSL